MDERAPSEKMAETLKHAEHGEPLRPTPDIQQQMERIMRQW
jgi:hypothetical protein